VHQATVALHAAAINPEWASLTGLRTGRSDVDINQDAIGQMELKAPIDGIIVFESNYSRGG